MEEYNVAHGCNYIVVDASQLEPSSSVSPLPNCPIIALYPDPAEVPLTSELADFDCWVTPTELEQLLLAITAQPIAATVLCQILRQTLSLSAERALVNESLAYGVLQSSKGFRQWLKTRSKPKLNQAEEPTVLTKREDGALAITLNRPSQHNAYNAQMRDELWAALQLASADTSISRITLRGNGPSFCSGGDLSEFGSVNDSGLAHIVRNSRNPGLLLSQIADQTHVEVHGACIGAGIELPAFCGHIKAKPDAYFKLPEIALGLIPGAGGTVSISRRIGRHATAKLALSGESINAQEALSLGLVDSIDSVD